MPEFTADWFSTRIPGWKRFLAELKGQPVHCLEIGSFEGRSALWLMENVCTHPDASLTCVDVWENADVQRRFDSNLSTKADKIVALRGPSWQELKKLPELHYSFAYIDGCHEGLNVMEDAVLAFRLVKPGGLICFDDYKWRKPHRYRFPKDAIDPFLNLWGQEIELLEKKTQVWLRKSSRQTRSA